MMRSILGAVAGYAAWTLIFLGSGFGIRSVMSSVHDEAGLTSNVAALSLYLVMSVVASLVAGLTVARIANAPTMRWVWVTAIALLATGIPVQISTWDAVPVWYNVVFLALLVPVTLKGGRLGMGAETERA